MAPDTLLPDKIVSCHLKGSFYVPHVPDHLLLSVLCHYKHLCRICWVSKVRILSSYATTSQRTTTRSSRAVNTEDCTLDIDYGKEISWSWEKPVILPCLHGRSVCVDAKRARRQKLYNRSLKGALENSDRLQNRDQSVNVIEKVEKKKGCKNAFHATFMHFLSCQVELHCLGVLYESWRAAIYATFITHLQWLEL